jgi:cytochrome c
MRSVIVLPMSRFIALRLFAGAAACALAGPVAAAPDADAAQKLIESNKCTKCHDVQRKKDGPAYRDVAAKFRGEPDAEVKVTHHVTAGEKVKFPDGHEEKHKKVKVESPADTENLVRWILGLEGGTKY